MCTFQKCFPRVMHGACMAMYIHYTNENIHDIAVAHVNALPSFMSLPTFFCELHRAPAITFWNAKLQTLKDAKKLQ